MKRKLIISLTATAAFIVTIGGVSAPATMPDSIEKESVHIHQNHFEKRPSAIAGHSWGGFGGGSDDTDEDQPNGRGRNSG